MEELLRTKLIKELLEEGKGLATQLQSLLNQQEHHDGSGSVDELLVKIRRCFTQAITLGNSKISLFENQIEKVDDDQVDSGDRNSIDCSSSELKKKEKIGGKDRRGCYKRRKMSGSWVRESETMNDGCAWRKYGQKNILNSKYPRCYYRCTHKKDEDCRATKQVQIVQENPIIIYHTTYFGNHTCNKSKILNHNNSQIFNHPILESPSNFEVTQKFPNSVTHDSTLVKEEEEEEEEEEESKGQSDNVSSTMDSNLWEDFMSSNSPISAHDSTMASQSSYYYEGLISSDMEDFAKFGDFVESIEFL